MLIPMRFNRLVMFQRQYWRAAAPGFGQSADNGRLVCLIFFQRPRFRQLGCRASTPCQHHPAPVFSPL